MEITLQVSDMAHVIQLAVAPVFLLAGIGGFLSVLSIRISRIVDRARVLEDRLITANASLEPVIRQELKILCRRAKLVNWAISLCTTCALLVCLVIMVLFIGTFLGLEIASVIALLFIISMAALIIALVIFLREIYIGTSSLRIGQYSTDN